MNLTLLVLAAGLGSRYGGLKQLDRVGPSGETIMDYAVYDAKKAGFNKVVFVIRKSLENAFKTQIFSKYQNFIAVDYVFQEMPEISNQNRTKPWGTGHAVLAAKNKINEAFLVINADDYYGAESYKIMADFLKNEPKKHFYGLLAFRLKNTLSENGKVSRGICKTNGNMDLIEITEHTEIQSDGKQILTYHGNKKSPEILPADMPTSMNFTGLKPDVFPLLEQAFDQFLKENQNSDKAEFYFPNFLSNMIENSQITVRVLQGNEHWLGITYPEDKKNIMLKLKDKNANFG